MIYIISEDSSAGCDFWVRLGNIFNLDICVLPCFGRDRMIAALFKYRKTRCFEYCCDGVTTTFDFQDASSIILLFDTFGVQRGFGTSGAYHKLIETGRFMQNYLNGCDVFVANYGSFESVLLTFEKFLQWVHTPSNDKCRSTSQHDDWKFRIDRLILLKAYRAFCSHYKDGKFIGRFFEPGRQDLCDKDIWEFVDQHEQLDNIHHNSKNAITNYEKLCSALLKHLTWGTDFIIDKNKIGTGWTCDCQDFCCDVGKFEVYDCQDNTLTDTELTIMGLFKENTVDTDLAMRNMTARKKLLTLFENSDFRCCFRNIVDLRDDAPYRSIKDVLGISHLDSSTEHHATDKYMICRLNESRQGRANSANKLDSSNIEELECTSLFGV